MRWNTNIADYSIDGITWSTISLPQSAKWISVTYGDDKFVAISQNNGTTIRSIDGITWADQAITLQYPNGEDVTNKVREALGVDVNKPTVTTITLTSSGWDSTAMTQTVNILGVLADETKQIITPTPAIASQAAYIESCILCTAQSVDALTFTASNIPAVDLIVYIIIQPL